MPMSFTQTRRPHVAELRLQELNVLGLASPGVAQVRRRPGPGAGMTGIQRIRGFPAVNVIAKTFRRT